MNKPEGHNSMPAPVQQCGTSLFNNLEVSAQERNDRRPLKASVAACHVA